MEFHFGIEARILRLIRTRYDNLARMGAGYGFLD
jgi:hypothetical protein